MLVFRYISYAASTKSRAAVSTTVYVHTARSVDWSVAKPLGKPVCPTTTGMSQSTHTRFVARSVAVVLTPRATDTRTDSRCVKSVGKDAYSPMFVLTNVCPLPNLSIVHVAASLSVNSKSLVHSRGTNAGAYITHSSLSPSLERLCLPGPLPGRILQLGVALPAQHSLAKKNS